MTVELDIITALELNNVSRHVDKLFSQKTESQLKEIVVELIRNYLNLHDEVHNNR